MSLYYFYNTKWEKITVLLYIHKPQQESMQNILKNKLGISVVHLD